LNVLIVDDNAAVRRLIAHILKPFACDMRECGDGSEAVTAYHLQRPDLVLMDIRMEEMGGIEAMKRIREVDPAAKIIIVTDYDDEALRRAAMHEGASGYSLKDNLLDLVRLLEGMGLHHRVPGTAAEREWINQNEQPRECGGE
jgi:two-component system NarL family response regulator